DGLQILFHALQVLNVRSDSFELHRGDLIYSPARDSAGIASLQDLSQLAQGEANPERSLHTEYTLDGALRIHPVAALGSRRSRQDADLFIMTNCVRAHSGGLSQCTGLKAFAVRLLHHRIINLGMDSRVKHVFRVRSGRTRPSDSLGI